MKKTILVLTSILLVGLTACGTSRPLSSPDPVSATPSNTAPEPGTGPQATPTDALQHPTDQPESVPPGLRVTYIRDGNLWSWTEAGGSAQLTDTGDMSIARLSDDGQLLAFIRGKEVWTVRMDGTDARLLVTLEEEGAAIWFAPDNSSLAISTRDHIEIVDLINVSSRTVVTYPALPEGYYPEVVWTVDASGFKTVIPPQNESGEAELLFVFTDGTVASLAKFSMLPLSENSPDISPDGGYVIYGAKLDDERESLYLMDSSGANRPYGEPLENVRSFGWLPDSVHFIFGDDNTQRVFMGNIENPPTEIRVDLPSMIRWIDAEHYLALENSDLVLGDLNAGRLTIDSDVQGFDFTP